MTEWHRVAVAPGLRREGRKVTIAHTASHIGRVGIEGRGPEEPEATDRPTFLSQLRR